MGFILTSIFFFMTYIYKGNYKIDSDATGYKNFINPKKSLVSLIKTEIAALETCINRNKDLNLKRLHYHDISKRIGAYTLGIQTGLFLIIILIKLLSK